jgi:hypothetical protein
MSAVLKEQALLESAATRPVRFQFWRGASGKRYVHTVQSLLTCPELPRAVYVLVRREFDGSRTPLRIGRTSSDCSTLNLAEVRHRAAKLGASEVHVHLIADSESERMLIEMDLQAGYFQAMQCEPAPAMRH